MVCKISDNMICLKSKAIFSFRFCNPTSGSGEVFIMTLKNQLIALAMVVGVMGGLILFGYAILWIVKWKTREKKAKHLRLVKSK